jgi:DNA-binding IclR family transcriptional regulator
MGSDARLSCSASGHAWLATMSDEEALALVSQQGLGLPSEFGPNAPASLQALLASVQATRSRGYSVTQETFTPGLNAMGAVVQLTGQKAIGVITIAGPSVRFSEVRMQALGSDLLSIAAQLATASSASPFFSKLKPIYAI